MSGDSINVDRSLSRAQSLVKYLLEQEVTEGTLHGERQKEILENVRDDLDSARKEFHAVLRSHRRLLEEGLAITSQHI